MKGMRYNYLLYFLLGLIAGWFSTECQPFFFALSGVVVFFYALIALIFKEKSPGYYFAFIFGFAFMQNLWMGDLVVPPHLPSFKYFGLCLTLFFSVWIALQFYLASRLVYPFYDQGRVYAFIGFVTLLEYHRLWFLCGYNFYTIGSFLEHIPSSQKIFSLAGPLGATFLILSAILVPVLYPRRRSSYFAMAIFIVGLALPRFEKVGSKIKVGFVQTARDPWRDEETRYMQKYLEWIEKIDDVDLLVFGETSIPCKYFFRYPDGMTTEDLLLCYKLESAIVNLSYNKNIDVIVGHVYPDDAGGLKNVASLVHKGEIVGRYEKLRLMSIMEASWNFLPDLINDSIDMGNFNPGRNKTVLKGKYNYGLNICYDDYFSQDSAIFSKKDVDLIVSLHNDIWINNPRFQWNHFRQSLLRSIETGISSVRTANGGLSGFARPDGSFRITDGAEGIQVLEVPLVKNNTLYPFLRDRLFILISAVAILAGYVRPYKKTLAPS